MLLKGQSLALLFSEANPFLSPEVNKHQHLNEIGSQFKFSASRYVSSCLPIQNFSRKIINNRIKRFAILKYADGPL